MGAGSGPCAHRPLLRDAKELRAQGGRVPPEVEPGAEPESAVTGRGGRLAEVDHQVLACVRLAPYIAAEQVIGEDEQVLGAPLGAALAPRTGAVTLGAELVGEQEDDPVGGLLLSGEPQHRTQLRDLLLLPLVKDDLTSAVALEKLREATDRVMETDFRRVNHNNLGAGQQRGSWKGSHRGPAVPPP